MAIKNNSFVSICGKCCLNTDIFMGNAINIILQMILMQA